MFEACLDGCQVGVVAPDNGLWMRKPWTIMSTDPHLAHCLGLRCDGGHPHTECVGHGRAVSSALYPPRMCKIISRHILSAQATSYLTQGDIHTNTPAVETNENEKERQEARKTTGVEGLQEAGEEPRNETIPMEGTESNQGSNHQTSCSVRTSHKHRVSELFESERRNKHFVQPALEHKCDSCQEVRLPRPHAKVSTHKSNTLWEVLQLDIGQFHVGNIVIHFLMLLDEASHFASACESFSS